MKRDMEGQTKRNVSIRATLLLLILSVLPASVLGHGSRMLGGVATLQQRQRLSLELEVPSGQLPYYVGSDMDVKTWADLARHADRLEDMFMTSLSLGCGGELVAPDTASIRALHGEYPPPPRAALPDFVPLTVEWTGIPLQPREVVVDFPPELGGVILVLRGEGSRPSPVTARERHTLRPGETRIVENAPESEAAWFNMLRHSLVIGFHHVLPGGLDHVLFVLSLYFACRKGRDLLELLLSFTLAHCIALGLVMAGIVHIPTELSRWIEVGIALSIVGVALLNCLGRAGGVKRVPIVFLFWLIHGVGFAGALLQLRWPTGGFLPALLAANLGIELAQLAVVAGAAVLTGWWWSSHWYRPRIVMPANLIIVAIGCSWLVERVGG
jgi:hypothetical protein